MQVLYVENYNVSFFGEQTCIVELLGPLQHPVGFVKRVTVQQTSLLVVTSSTLRRLVSVLPVLRCDHPMYNRTLRIWRRWKPMWRKLWNKKMIRFGLCGCVRPVTVLCSRTVKFFNFIGRKCVYFCELWCLHMFQREGERKTWRQTYKQPHNLSATLTFKAVGCFLLDCKDSVAANHLRVEVEYIEDTLLLET